MLDWERIEAMGLDARQYGGERGPNGRMLVPYVAPMTSRVSELAAAAFCGLAIGLIIACLTWNYGLVSGYANGAADTASACLSALAGGGMKP